MVICVTMVRVVPGYERSVYYSLKNKDGILDVYHIFGKYDFFVIMQSDGLEKLNQLINNMQEIHSITVARTILIGWDHDLQSPKPVQATA